MPVAWSPEASISLACPWLPAASPMAAGTRWVLPPWAGSSSLPAATAARRRLRSWSSTCSWHELLALVAAQQVAAGVFIQLSGHLAQARKGLAQFPDGGTEVVQALRTVVQGVVVAVEYLVHRGRGALERRHGIARAFQCLPARTVHQRIGVADQRLGLDEGLVGLLAGRGHLLDQGTQVAAFVGDGAGGLLDVVQRVLDAVDVFVGQQLGGAQGRLAEVGYQVFAVGEQFGERRGVGDDHRRGALGGYHKVAAGGAAGELDHRHAGAADAGELVVDARSNSPVASCADVRDLEVTIGRVIL